MRSMILMGCLWMLSTAAYTQENERIRAGTLPVRGIMSSLDNSSRTLPAYFGMTDTAAHYRMANNSTTQWDRNPNTTRFANVDAFCDFNSTQFKWTAIQQFSADWFKIEQSTDRRNWSVVAEIPANRTAFGEAGYRYTYNRNIPNAWYRLKAVTIGGDEVTSALMQSPCSNEAALAVTPNPVYTTTTVTIGSPTASKVKLILLNSSGGVVHSSEAGLVQGKNYLPLDMSNLPSGYYTLYISWSNGEERMLNLIKK
jgi:hypothetical protein